MAIRIDSETGLKLFNTRAISNYVGPASQGYAVVEDQALKSLPEFQPDTAYNDEAKEKYRKYKNDRAGAANYKPIKGEFAHYLDDAYSSEAVDRESLDDECEILVIGAGFSGLMLWHKL